MPTGTYVAIQTTNVASATQTVSLTSIPSTYTDLIVVITAKSDGGNNAIRMRINNDSSAIYNDKYWSGTNTNTSVGGFGNDGTQSLLANYVGAPSTLGDVVHVLQFFNYANTAMWKKVGTKTGGARSSVVDNVDLMYRSQSAINRLDFNINSFGSSTGNFAAGSTFCVYGIKAGV